MRKKFLLFAVFIFLISQYSFSQDNKSDTIPKADSLRIKVDTTMLNSKQQEFKNIANDLIQNSIAKKESDSLTALKEKIKIEIDNLKKDHEKNKDEIEKKNKEIADLESLINKRKSLLEEYDKKITEVSSNYDSLKVKEIKIGKANDSLNKQTEIIKKQSDSLSKKNNEAEVQLNKLLKEIAEKEDSLEAVAKIEIKDSVIVYKHRPGNHNDIILFKTKITNAHIAVRDGILLEIIVTTDSGIFRNKRFIADLLHFDDYGFYHLWYVKQDYRSYGDFMCIFLDDAIKYSPIRSFSDIPYADFDIDLSIPDNKTYLLRESTSLNTYFSVKAFTDIKGISGEPNGLAQFTGDAKFIVNSRPIRLMPGKRKGSDTIKDIRVSALVPLNFISFCGGLSKFDNDFKGTEILMDSVNRKDLLQRANHSVGVKLNLLKKYISPNPYFLFSYAELNVGFNFIGSKVFDTSLKGDNNSVIDTSFRNITSNQYYIEPTMTFNRHRNFSMTLSMPFFINTIMESAKIKNRTTEYWACPSISLMYYGKRDAGSKLFFRYNHYINLKDKEFAFSQMQLGYSLSLTKVWGNNN